MSERKTDELARRAEDRVVEIGHVRKVLWIALCRLLGNGDPNATEEIKHKANEFTRVFEDAEDARFFDDLIVELESASKVEEHDKWIAELVDRARRTLERVFKTGPRSAERRDWGHEAAMTSFFHALRSDKLVSPQIIRVLKERSGAREKEQHGSSGEVGT